MIFASNNLYELTIYAPMIYTAPCVMFLMRADTLLGEVVGELALEISSFVGPCEMARAYRRVPLEAQKILLNQEGNNRQFQWC